MFLVVSESEGEQAGVKMAGLNPGQVKSPIMLRLSQYFELILGGGGLPEQSRQPAACGDQGGGGAAKELGDTGACQEHPCSSAHV